MNDKAGVKMWTERLQGVKQDAALSAHEAEAESDPVLPVTHYRSTHHLPLPLPLTLCVAKAVA